MTIKKEKMERLNSYVPKEQKKFIKDLAKKLGKGEGEVTRDIIQLYIISFNTKVQ